MNALLTIDLANLVVSIVLIWITAVVILRTEKGIDKVFKLFLLSVIFWFIKAIFELNNETGILSPLLAKPISSGMHLLAVVFMAFGMWKMLQVIKKEIKNEN